MPRTIIERVVKLESVIPQICEDIHDIKDNHLHEIKNELKEMSKAMTSMKRTSAEVRTDVTWLKKYHWVVIGASVGSLIGQLINFVK